MALLRLLNILRESPNFDQRAIDEYMVETHNLPQKLLKSKDEVEQEQQAQAEMVAQQQIGEELAQVDPLVSSESLQGANAMKESPDFSAASLEQQPPPEFS